MKKLTDLQFLFTVIAVLEFFYFAAAMMPPSLVTQTTGWVLNADGHWITKIVGLALLFQAYIAWSFRKNPLLPIAKGLAFYQLASATADWIMWLALKNDGIFSTSLAQVTVTAAIVSHYAVGFLLIIAIRNYRV